MTYLILLSREIISALYCSRYIRLQTRISSIVCAKDGVLEASGITNLHLQLAKFTAIACRDVRSGFHDVAVKEESESRAIVRKKPCSRLIRATSTAVADLLDLNLAVWRGSRSLRRRCRGAKSGQSEKCYGNLHG